jgi:hypothetical protein
MRIERRWIFILALATLLPAQTEQHCGIEGYVSSDVADALSGATINIDSITRGFHRQAASNGSGYYLVDGLTPGAYSVSAEVKGLGCIVYPKIPIFAGKRVRQDFRFVEAKRNPDSCQPAQTMK